MIELLRRMLDPAYLYALDPGPLGPWRAVYLAWAILLFLGCGAALWWQRRARHTAAAVTAWACGAGLALVGMRLLAPRLAGLRLASQLSAEARTLLLDVWTARVWPISATWVAVLVPLIYGISRFRLPPLLQRQVDALTGSLVLEKDLPSDLRRWENVVLGGIHLVGLAWLWVVAGQSPWWAVPSLLALSVVPVAAAIARPHRPRLETLAPLFLSYLGSIVYWFVSRYLHIDLEGYQGFVLPDLWSPWFNISVVVSASVAYTLWIQVRLAAQGWEEAFRHRALVIAPVLLVALWLGSVVLLHRTFGVTASDPYCYVQMAVDLADSGSPLHRFPLAGLARDLGLPTWPAVHIGYHPPSLEDLAPTMWSAGWPMLLVPAYRLGGLSAVYAVAPLMSACALLVAWCLANEVLRDLPPAVRWTVAGLTCWLTATSPEGSERILVPMADAAAQLFTLLTLWLLLRGQRLRPVLHSLLAGASLGVAYWIRHPQLPLALAALAAVWAGRRPYRARLSALIAFGVAAFAVAVPDLAYHRQVFGSWLHTESTEWFLLSPGNMGRSFFAVLQQGILRREEVGFMTPFAVYGAWLLWREKRRPALVLASGFGAVLLFHLCYAALRPRDLIAILPVLYLCAAYGFVVAWRHGQGRRTVSSALWLTCCLVLLFARSYRTLALPWRDDVTTFGHISASQYRSFAALSDLLPDGAVVGSMLNGGAIELHSGRGAVHPAPWTEDELRLWVDGLLARGTPFYVLDDGEEMRPVLARLERDYALELIQTLDLPYFALGGGNLPLPARLYRVEPIH
ncbi:MAG: glycosyltransferase family 39 protein [Anaerolineae bacterium]|nr:glycosyltransferase family 39 protein [Anaerolineae bacterium]